LLLYELAINGRHHHRMLLLWHQLLVVPHILAPVLSRPRLPVVGALLEPVIDSAVIVDILTNDAHIFYEYLNK
jgi:hypothetical protein